MATNNAINLSAAGVVTYNGSGSFTGSSITQNAVIYGGASDSLSSLGPLTDGQLVVGSTGVAPVAATLTAGSGISIANGAGTITISVTGGGLPWTEVTGTSQAAAVNNGYITNNAGLVTVTLPATASIGDNVRIAGKGAGGWSLAANTGQTIIFGNQESGTAMSVDSTDANDCIEVICITANTTWEALSSIGNLTVNT